MKIFKIPLMERSTWFGNARALCHYSKLKFVDGVGFYFYHPFDCPKEEFEDDKMRNYGMSRQSTFFIVEADTPEQAIYKFYNTFEGSRQSKEIEKNALWIDDREDILEYPECERAHWNKLDQLVCGELEKDRINGKNGMCILWGTDYPEEDCPIQGFPKEKSLVEKIEIEVNGQKLKVVRLKKAGRQLSLPV